jgi:type VI secretion system protein ImpF
MALADVRDRLQPALLDRLTDDAPTERSEGDESRVMNKAQLRRAVLRDLAWLFNAVQPLSPAQARADPVLASSVLNYGLPPMSGRQISRLDVHQLRRDIRSAIERFEPRILRETLEVRALRGKPLLEAHNLIEFEISGHLWGQPMPIELLLRTAVDLESGQIEVRDAAAGAPRRARDGAADEG